MITLTKTINKLPKNPLLKTNKVVNRFEMNIKTITGNHQQASPQAPYFLHFLGGGGAIFLHVCCWYGQSLVSVCLCQRLNLLPLDKSLVCAFVLAVSQWDMMKCPLRIIPCFSSRRFPCFCLQDIFSIYSHNPLPKKLSPRINPVVQRWTGKGFGFDA